MKQSKLTSQLFVLMGAVLWGTTGSTQAFAPISANPLSIGALRMLIGGLALFLLALFKGSFSQKHKLNKLALLIAGASIAVFQPLFFTAVSISGVAFGTVLAIGSSPIFSGIIDSVMGDKPSKKWVIATSISIIGCVFLFSGQLSLNLNITGAIFALLAGFAYATYVVSTQRLLQHNPKEIVNAAAFLVSALILLPILFMYDISWAFTLRGSIVVLHLGIVTVALAYTLFSIGLVNISPSRAVTLTLAEPLTASLLGIFILKENLTLMTLLGITLIFAGLVLNSRPEKEGELAELR